MCKKNRCYLIPTQENQIKFEQIMYFCIYLNVYNLQNKEFNNIYCDTSQNTTLLCKIFLLIR